MNLALQKRHEQLERWRQNEEQVELSLKLQQQQQQQKVDSSEPSNKLTSFNKFSPNRRGNSVDEDGEFKKSIGLNHKKEKSNLVKFSNSTLFLTSCANGDISECERLLNDGLIDIDVTTSEGLTGLHQAAICNNAQMVEFLISRGANINCCDSEGWTPLHAAASLGLTPIVKLLLDLGAAPTIVNCENLLAYDLARNDQVQALIADHLQDVDIDYLRTQEERAIQKDIDMWLKTGRYDDRSHPLTNATVLHVLAAKGHTKLMKQILESPILKKQINLESKDNEGFTPLLAASFWSQNEIVELLIEHGANIFAEANNGYKISSIHLKNYQQSKMQQSQTGRLPIQSPDNTKDNLATRSTTSLDSSGTELSYDDSESLPRSGIGAISSSVPRHLRNQGNLLKSQSLDIGQQQQLDTATLLSGTMSVDRLLLRSESMTERELRKSYKELVMENERLKKHLKALDDKEKQKSQDWIRKERQLERKISELEEENKSLEQWKQESQRLKDENSSLIRVLSKLSKKQN